MHLKKQGVRPLKLEYRRYCQGVKMVWGKDGASHIRDVASDTLSVILWSSEVIVSDIYTTRDE